MHLAPRRALRSLPLLLVALAAFASPAASLTLTLRSGNAAPGNPDPLITRFDLATTCGAGYPTAFTAADFAAASSGPQAVVLSSIHPFWGQSLQCDPLAQWIGIDPTATPLSALFAMDFNLPAPCCDDRVLLDFCWVVDDLLGDAINPAGLYVNGTPIPAVAGGNYATDTYVSGIDITTLVHCGTNTLYVHNRDVGCAVSGVMFSAKINAIDCATPAVPSSWGRLKTLYR